MKELYNKIIEIFESPETRELFKNRGVSPPIYIDMDRGQYTNSEDFEVMKYPAILFGWNINHDANPLKKIGEVSITLSIFYEEIRGESNNQSKDRREKALKFFDFIDCIQMTIRGIESKNTGKLSLVSEGVYQKDEQAISVYQLQYKCSYTDTRYLEDKNTVDIKEIDFN